MIARTATAALLAVFIIGTTAHAQQAPPARGGTQPPGGAPGQPGGRGQGRGGPRGPQPLPFESHEGFTSIFDGTSLKGWDGDPKFWRAEGGALVGQTTPENKLTENTFLIWRGGEPADFELKLEFRIDATNSGVQIRSAHLPAGTPDGRGGTIAGKWVMKGYQADIDFTNDYTGQIYEERGRGFLALRGQAVYVPAGGGPKVVGKLQQSTNELKAIVRINDWNQIHIIARGAVIMQVLNGAVTSIVVDDDAANRALSGLVGLQLHAGAPMKAEFRDIWLKKL